LNEKRDESEEHVRKVILKMDHFRQENERLVNEMAIRDSQVVELASRIKEQQAIIDSSRNANERVYEKYEITGKQLGKFNAERLILESQARDAMAETVVAREGQL
jgi:hypothetical protein